MNPWRRFQEWICRNGHGHWPRGVKLSGTENTYMQRCSVCGSADPYEYWPESR